MLVRFLGFFYYSCTYQSMQSYPIITSNLFFLVSHHTVAALFIPPHRRKTFESILARSFFRTLASGSSDMYRMEYFAVAMRASSSYRTLQRHIRKALGLQMWWRKNKNKAWKTQKQNKDAVKRH